MIKWTGLAAFRLHAFLVLFPSSVAHLGQINLIYTMLPTFFYPLNSSSHHPTTYHFHLQLHFFLPMVAPPGHVNLLAITLRILLYLRHRSCPCSLSSVSITYSALSAPSSPCVSPAAEVVSSATEFVPTVRERHPHFPTSQFSHIPVPRRRPVS